MPQWLRGARMNRHEDFRGPGLEEVGFRSYAHLTSGRRVLIRRRVGERIEVSPASRHYFARYKVEVIAHVPVLNCWQNKNGTYRVVRMSHSYVPINDERFMMHARQLRGLGHLGHAHVGARATQEQIREGVLGELISYLDHLPKVKDAVEDYEAKGLGPVANSHIVFWEYDGFVVWDETRAITFDERLTSRARRTLQRPGPPRPASTRPGTLLAFRAAAPGAHRARLQGPGRELRGEPDVRVLPEVL